MKGRDATGRGCRKGGGKSGKEGRANVCISFIVVGEGKERGREDEKERCARKVEKN